ncbi:LmeA family phospholipid-binding protein [Parasphingorhabdus pacifica]
MKKLVITLVIVVGLLVAVDFGAAAVAEHQVAKKMRAELQLEEQPAVRINGFPFLAQVAMGDYRDVELEARAVQVADLQEVGIEANLHHARVTTSELISGDVQEIPVDEVVGRVKLKAPDVGRFIGINDLGINPAPKSALEETGGSNSSGGTDSTDGSEDSGGTDGSSDSGFGSTGGTDRSSSAVAFDGKVNIAGENTDVRVIAEMSLVNGKLRIEPKKLDIKTGSFGEIDLPELFEKSLLRQFTTTLDPGLLPFEVTPTAVRAERGALVVEGTAKDVTLGSNGMTTP